MLRMPPPFAACAYTFVRFSTCSTYHTPTDRSADGQLISAGQHQEGDAENRHDGRPHAPERRELPDLPVVPEIEQGHRDDLGVWPDQKKHQGYRTDRQQEYEKPARNHRRDQERQDDPEKCSGLTGTGDGGGLLELGMNLDDADLRITQSVRHVSDGGDDDE